ncbi:MAG: hypothetical protein J5J00_08660 [Deltaproteobacteria bacterium]|nr:hypothetical protein [Deltaproteobacteria bacterium]
MREPKTSPIQLDPSPSLAARSNHCTDTPTFERQPASINKPDLRAQIRNSEAHGVALHSNIEPAARDHRSAHSTLVAARANDALLGRLSNKLEIQLIAGDLSRTPAEARLHSMVQNCKVEEMPLLRQCYKERFKADLAQVMSRSRTESQRSGDLFSDDPVKRATAVVNEILENRELHRALPRVLGSLHRSQVQGLYQCYAQSFDLPLEQAIRSALGEGALLHRTLHIIRGEQVLADACSIRSLTETHSDLAALRRLLRSISSDSLPAVLHEYKQIYGQSLEELFDPRVAKIAELPLIRRMELAEIRAVIEAGGADLYETLGAIIADLPDQEISKLQKQYCDAFGSDLAADIKSSQLTATQLQAITTLLAGHELTSSQAVAGPILDGLSHHALKQALTNGLEGGSLIELQKIARELSYQYGIDLQGVIESRLSAPDRFDIKLLMLGSPETLQQEKLVIDAKHSFEIPQSQPQLLKLINRAAERSINLSSNYEDLRQAYDRLNRNEVNFCEDDEVRLYAILEDVEAELRRFRAMRATLTQLCSNLCALAGGAFGFFVSHRSNYPLSYSLACAAAFASLSKLCGHYYFSQRFGDEGKILNELQKQLRAQRKGPISRRSKLKRRLSSKKLRSAQRSLQLPPK